MTTHETTTESYTVTGMTCDHCARAVATEVGALPGVVDVDVEVASGLLRVTSAQRVELEQLREAVAEAGYALQS